MAKIDKDAVQKHRRRVREIAGKYGLDLWYTQNQEIRGLVDPTTGTAFSARTDAELDLIEQKMKKKSRDAR